MVSYWKTKGSTRARITRAKEGHYQMEMAEEKYPFPGFPRGILLYGHLSKVKHQIKNLFFNDSWKQLEDGVNRSLIIKRIRGEVLDEIVKMAEDCRFIMFPQSRMCPVVKELYRALTTIEGDSKRLKALKEILCFILQEDDAYRFRFQWIINYFNPSSWTFRLFKNPLKVFDYALSMLEHGEIVGDMKERMRLLRRILMLILEDKEIKNLFLKLCKEADWEKMKLTKADKYFFRAKWFKVDLDIFAY